MFTDGLTLAKVAKIHPGGHAVDLLFLQDGSRVPMVQVVSQSASTNTGHADLTQPDMPASGDAWDFNDSKTRDMYAVVGFMNKYPIVLGFLFPQVCQMLFADINRRVDRHASDFYTTIDDAGNLEVYHPSGTFLRIGESPAHEDLTGKDVDGKWAIKRNTARAPHVHLSVANAGAPVASLDIDPSGNLAGSFNGSGNLTFGGAVTVKAPTATVDAGSTTCTGSLTVAGATTLQGGLAVSGGSGASISGPLTATGDIKSGSISLPNHKHTDPQGGTTGPAQ